MNLGRRSRFSRMTDITVFDRPGNLAIMAGTTILPIDNFQHIDLITAGFHFETQIGVTDLASEADAVKPVRENDRAHCSSIRIIIYQYIAIFGMEY